MKMLFGILSFALVGCNLFQTSAKELTLDEVHELLLAQDGSKNRPDGDFIVRDTLVRDDSLSECGPRLNFSFTRTSWGDIQFSIWLVPSSDTIEKKALQLVGKPVTAIIEFPPELNRCLSMCYCDAFLELKSIELQEN